MSSKVISICCFILLAGYSQAESLRDKVLESVKLDPPEDFTLPPIEVNKPETIIVQDGGVCNIYTGYMGDIYQCDASLECLDTEFGYLPLEDQLMLDGGGVCGHRDTTFNNNGLSHSGWQNANGLKACHGMCKGAGNCVAYVYKSRGAGQTGRCLLLSQFNQGDSFRDKTGYVSVIMPPAEN